MLDEPDADIANIINNFLIDAQALRASQQSLSSKVQAQSTAFVALAEQMRTTRQDLLQIAKSGVTVRLDSNVQQIEKLGGDMARSISSASKRAEQALTAKLQEIEAAKANGLLMTLIVAVVSSLTTVAVIYALPIALSLLANGVGS